MSALLGGRIVAGWARNTFGMPTFRVHPADYPEIEAEGRAPDEACDHLVLLLVQAIEFAGESWKCQPSGWPSPMPAPSPPWRGPSRDHPHRSDQPRGPGHPGS